MHYTSIIKVPLIASAIFLAGCAETTTEQANRITQAVTSADANTAVIARKTGFQGSAVPMYVFLDNVKVASVKNNRTATFNVPKGKHTVMVKIAGPGALTTKPASLTINKAATAPVYLIIGLRAGFLGASLSLSEVSAATLTQ